MVAGTIEKKLLPRSFCARGYWTRRWKKEDERKLDEYVKKLDECVKKLVGERWFEENYAAVKAEVHVKWVTRRVSGESLWK